MIFPLKIENLILELGVIVHSSTQIKHKIVVGMLFLDEFRHLVMSRNN